MAFKDLCCGLCAWFSVIGAGTFAVLATMLARGNIAVIEHKFHLSGEDQSGIDAAHYQMIVMCVVMIVSAGACFVSSMVLAKSAARAEEEANDKRHQ